MQHNESDWNFLTRLLRSENISWLIDEAQHIVPSTDTSIQAQKLRLIDANSQYQPLDRKTIRYHRSSAVEQYDSMTRLTAERSLQPNVMHIQRWQAEILDQEEGIEVFKVSISIVNIMTMLHLAWSKLGTIRLHGLVT